MKKGGRPNQMLNSKAQDSGRATQPLDTEQVLAAVARLKGQCFPSFKTHKKTYH